MTEIIARRQFAPLYIWLDTAFLIVFMILLMWRKKYMTVAVGLVMGVVYMLVDYGIFNLLLGTRSISEGHSLFLVLLWMSMSYGFTNFAYMALDVTGQASFRVVAADTRLVVLLPAYNRHVRRGGTDND